MIKRLASAAAVSVSFSLLAVAPASAANCGLLGLLCPPPPPTPVTVPVTVPVPVAVPVAPAVAAPLPAPAPAPLPPAAPPAPVAGDAPEAAALLLNLVNQERDRAGLPALQPRAAIEAVAAGQSRAMAGRGQIWHNDAFFKAATRSALGARGLGENVAMNGSVENAHQRLMASPGHRANILSRAFDAVGISVVRDTSGAVYITQNFVDSKVTAKPKAKAPRRPSARRPAPRTTRPAARR